MYSHSTKSPQLQQNYAENNRSAGPQGASLQAPAYGLDFTDNNEVNGGEILQAKFAETQNATAPAMPNQEVFNNNTGLPDQLKTGIEQLSGYSMDKVKVHYNSSKPAQVNALAYAQGTDIHLGAGQEKHLPHEAWHVVQQMQGRVKANAIFSGTKGNDDPGLEQEATNMGGKAAFGAHGPNRIVTENNRNFEGVVQRTTIKEFSDEKKRLDDTTKGFANAFTQVQNAVGGRINPATYDLGDEDTLKKKLEAVNAQIAGHFTEVAYFGEKIHQYGSNSTYLGAFNSAAGRYGADVTTSRSGGGQKSIQFKAVSSEKYAAAKNAIVKADKQIAGQTKSGEMPVPGSFRAIYIDILSPDNPFPFTTGAGWGSNIDEDALCDELEKVLLRGSYYGDFDQLKIRYKSPRKVKSGSGVINVNRLNASRRNRRGKMMIKTKKFHHYANLNYWIDFV